MKPKARQPAAPEALPAGVAPATEALVHADRDGETLELVAVHPWLRFRNLTNCVVRCAPVETSVCIQDCRGCDFQVAGQQIRVDGVSDCTLRVYTPTGTVVERSEGYRVLPYDFAYPELGPHMRQCGLEGRPNRWDSVYDLDRAL